MGRSESYGGGYAGDIAKRSRSAFGVRVSFGPGTSGVRRLAHVLGAVLVVVAATPVIAAAEEATVAITDRLDPARVTVQPGTTVTWHNQSGAERRMRSRTGPEEFDSGNLDPGESFSFTFAVEGTYAYLDERDDGNEAYFGSVIVATDPGNEPPELPPVPGDGQVSIVNRTYQPRSIQIDTGGRVTWRNDDDRAHTVTASDRSWDSGVFDTGGAFSRVFATAGTYSYFCILHPDMTGTVVVTGDGGGEAPPPPGPPPPPEPPPPPRPPATGDVSIVDFAYSPVALTVTEGAMVTWANGGAAPHTVTATDGTFDSGFLFTGDTFATAFAVSGTYDYFCTIHPEMRATVVVTGAGPGVPTPPSPPSPPPPPLPPEPGGGGGGSGGGAATPGSIAIVDNAFDPGTRTVSAGTTVVWSNTGVLPHTVTAGGGSFDSGILMPGDQFRARFDRTGTFDYLCAIHPGMAGSIVVTGTSTGGSSPPAQDPGTGASPSPEPPEQTRAAAAGAPGAASVVIVDNGYRPPDLTIRAGGTVAWSNSGEIPHTVTARDDSFDSGFLMPGDGYSRVYVSPGVYEYFCSLHPEMVAVVTVLESAEPVDAASPDEPAAATVEDGSAPDPAEAPPPSGAVTLVGVVDNEYRPGNVTIVAGETIRWVNRGDLPHTVTARDDEFDSGLILPGGSFAADSLEPGAYEYFCLLHPEMVGTLEVLAAADIERAAIAPDTGSGLPSLVAAFVLAGSMIAAMGVFVFGMVRFGEAAARGEI